MGDGGYQAAVLEYVESTIKSDSRVEAKRHRVPSDAFIQFVQVTSIASAAVKKTRLPNLTASPPGDRRLALFSVHASPARGQKWPRVKYTDWHLMLNRLPFYSTSVETLKSFLFDNA